MALASHEKGHFATWQRPGLLFLFALAVNLAGVWLLPLIDRDETYYAEVTREMIARSDYVLPRFNNQPWLQKPPLLYWAQSVTFRLLGENALAARLPTALAGAVTALIIFFFGSRLENETTGWRAAIIYTLCLQLTLYGRAGTPDVLVVMFSTLAAWAGWELCQDEPGRHKWWWMFYTSLAGCALAKGPLALLPVAAILLYAWWTRPPHFFQRMKFVRGLALTLALASLWFVPIMIKTNGEFYRVFIGKQVLLRSLAPMEGHGAKSVLGYIALLPLYFALLFPALLPWSYYIVPAARRIWRERTPAQLYLAAGIIVVFGLFSVVRTKLPHYTLPAFPLLACALAPCVPPRRFVQLAFSAVAFDLVVAFVVFPLLARQVVPAQLARSSLLQSNMEIATVDYREPGLIWELRRKIKGPSSPSPRQGVWVEVLEPSKINDFMSRPGPRVCVLPTKLLRDLPADAKWKIVSAQGIDFAKFKPLDLSMIVKTEAPGPADATGRETKTGGPNHPGKAARS